MYATKVGLTTTQFKVLFNEMFAPVADYMIVTHNYAFTFAPYAITHTIICHNLRCTTKQSLDLA